MSKQRNMSIDIIKCLAIFSVIGVHFILNTSSNIVINSNLDIAIYLAYRQIFIVCVPLFLLTTGYLNTEKEPTKIYYKKILPIISIYFFYSIVSLVFRNAYMQETISIIKGIRLIFTFQAISYAWYINMFIGLYILIPFLNKIVKSSSKKELQLFILVLLIISILPATWNNFSEILGYSNIFPLPNFWISIYPISYYIVGCYLKVHPVKLKKNRYYLYTAFIVYLTAVGINYIYSDIGNISNTIKDYSSLPILVQSICLFIFISTKKIDFKMFNSLITKIAKYTLEIYLISYVVDNFIYKFFKTFIFSNTIKDFIYSLPIVVSTFIISFLIVFLLKYLKNITINKMKKEKEKYLLRELKKLRKLQT
ncbi:acyltransferase [Carnobacterium inhibens]|uniref:acyltransferase n=1 Tax=Carnobacterium inhibens TaxID=147709 RepID=UPI00203FF58D|nr:acyltransferase family protein [Carnobacterium inhibens]MCM3511407.1 acyltransferase family protein [Carnobacterium inhibens]